MAQLSPKQATSGTPKRYTSREAYLFVFIWVSVLVMMAIIIVPVTARRWHNLNAPPTSMAGGAMPVAAPTPPHLITPGHFDVEVHPQVELMSVIFRLAGNPEYNQAMVGSYARDVEANFGAFRTHEAVRYALALRNTKGISFDAPMSLAIHLDSVTLLPRGPFNPLPRTLDARWTYDEATRFIELARVFWRDSNFDLFLQMHQPVYDLLERRLRDTVGRRGSLAWFSAFYGIRQGASFVVVPALLNGGNCYGASFRESGTEQIYCIVGVWAEDEGGLPVFQDDVLPTVVHEFCHSYINPFVERHLEAFRPAGEAIFRRVERPMRRNNYGLWPAMIRESLVRASVICYLRAYGDAGAAEDAIRTDKELGFEWIVELADRLGEYDSDRGTYPDLESFSSELVAFFNDYAGIDGEQSEAEEAGEPHR